MKNLKINIITMNHQQTIERCLDSISCFENINIVDLNSSDNTISLCGKKYTVKQYKNIKDISRIINENLDANKWNLILYGNEVLMKGLEELKEICSSKEQLSFNVKILYKNTVNQELRLWNKNLTFKNPVCETVEDEKSLNSKSILFKSLDCDNENFLIKKNIIEEWKKNEPLNLEVYYYEAMNELMLKNYNKFIALSVYYLKQKSSGFSSALLCYYLAIVYGSILNDWNKAIQFMASCIDYDPTVAEFWCFLGDIYFNLNQKIKALSFYENALILGKKRKSTNAWSIDVSKYKIYPEKMIKAISVDF